MSSNCKLQYLKNTSAAYPFNLNHRLAHMWAQWLPNEQRYICHLNIKKKFHSKASCGTLLASLEQMGMHAQNEDVPKTSMPCTAFCFDKFEGDKVRLLHHDPFKICYCCYCCLSRPEAVRHFPAQATKQGSSLGGAQKSYEALINNRDYISKE